MQCNLECPKCKEIHDVNSKYCDNCGFDLELYIIKFKGKHLPIHFNGGVVDTLLGVDEDEDDSCLGGLCDCCCGSSKKKKKQGCCDCLLDFC